MTQTQMFTDEVFKVLLTLRFVSFADFPELEVTATGNQMKRYLEETCEFGKMSEHKNV